ncbi:hypothetical protein [Methylotenera sp. G11]|uniref:hypothetical protein n=1 Tax=Methylotenera sp. G11 TaxID=1506585 RepID=UPI000645FBE3|nr:hypothetical protein [Methylotenera sp. G11]
MFVTKKMIKNLLTGFSAMLDKQKLMPALLFAVPVIPFAALHEPSRSVYYTPINPDNTMKPTGAAPVWGQVA